MTGTATITGFSRGGGVPKIKIRETEKTNLLPKPSSSTMLRQTESFSLTRHLGTECFQVEKHKWIANQKKKSDAATTEPQQ